ncbi:hypothetical protein MHYP_G00363500 [Metynnis hypsauchen]
MLENSLLRLRRDVQELQQEREALRNELTAAEQLFPGSKVAKVWCPRTSDALHLLTHAISGDPNHIIIHTGTNDLRAQQERVADSIRRVAQTTTQAFPSTKITISSILPRRDFHPATIQKINAEISRGCALMANVHLAHYPNLSIHSLHDHVHLHKDVVNTFAKNLKDVALGRSPNSPPRSNRPPSLHTARLQYPPPPREVSTHRATRHYRPPSQPQQHNYSTPRAAHRTTPLHRYPRLIPAPRPPDTIYIPPSESPHYDEDIFPSLHHQISSFQAQGSVLICGDLNAHTGSLPDFNTEQGNNYIFGHQHPGNISDLPRFNSDPQVNRNGKDLLQLCQSLGLYIISGGLRGDSLGRFTFCSPLGNSTVDYMVTDLEPFSLSAFTVKALTPLSDHSQITVFIKRTETNSTAHTQPSELYSIRRPYRWAQNSTEEFQKAIRDPNIQTLLDTFLDTTYTHSNEGVNLAVRNINHIFTTTAQTEQGLQQNLDLLEQYCQGPGP